MKPLSIVIFSKDRAAQLDLCLKSIYKNLETLSEQWRIYIVYTASSKEFESGYTKLSGEWNKKPSVYFLSEKKYGGFKKTLEYCMKHWEDHVLFFTDDDIAYRKLEYKYEEIVREELFCTSLRLGSNTFVQDQYINSHCFIPDEVNASKEKLKRWQPVPNALVNVIPACRHECTHRSETRASQKPSVPTRKHIQTHNPTCIQENKN